MADLAGVFAASHAPLMVGGTNVMPNEANERLNSAFAAIGKQISAARPDVIIVIGPDHWSNFYLDNFPTITLGVGEEHEGPPEPMMSGFPHKTFVGEHSFGRFMVEKALSHDFEPSISYRLKLDHGICVPLWLLDLPRMPSIVPILLNTVEPPFMSCRRCLQWGALVADSVKSYRQNLKFVILATGGLSHSIGTPTMGVIDEKFDRECLRRFSSASDEELVKYLDDNLETGGNGAQEIRSWLVAHGAAGGRGFKVVDYLPVPQVYVGCAFAQWNLMRPERD